MSTSPFACTQGTVSSGSLVLIGAIALGATSAFLALGGSMEGALVGNQTRGGIAAGPRSPSHPGPADAATPVPAVSTQAGLGGLPHTAVGLYKKALRSGAARNVGGAPTGARELLHTTSGGTRTRLLLPVAEGSNIPVVAFRPGLAAIGDLYPTIVGKILESGRAVALIDSPNPLSLNLEGRVADVMRGIDWLEEVADGGLLDFDRLGITGHSMGGSESFALSRLDRRVRTAVSMAPGWPPNPARGLGQRTNTVIENALSMDGPEVRIIGARHDRVVKADDYARYLSDRCTNCEYVEMNHAGHNNFADMPVPGVPGLIRGRSGDRLGRVDVTALSSRVATGQRQRLEAANLVTQWFDQVLGVSPYSAH